MAAARHRATELASDGVENARDGPADRSDRGGASGVGAEARILNFWC